MRAQAVLEAAVRAALAGVAGLSGVHGAGPVQAALPHAMVEAGVAADWGHKSGAGREVRLAVTIRDGGEAAERLHGLAEAAEAAIAGIGGEMSGWRVVSLVLLRSRTVRERGGWAAVSEYRARMLAV